VFDESNPAQQAVSDYALAMGLPSSGSAISDNYGRYCRTFAGYVSGKAEAANDTAETDRWKNNLRRLGDLPQLVIKKAIRPKGGELRELVLPGGGDLCLRVWSGLRQCVVSLTNWFKRGATNTTAFTHHIGWLESFLDGEDQHHAHAWSLLDARPKLRMHCEILLFLEMIQPPFGYDGERVKLSISCKKVVKNKGLRARLAGSAPSTEGRFDNASQIIPESPESSLANSDLLAILDETVELARTRGVEQLNAMLAKNLAFSLRGGAGKAHRAANVDNSLPPLRLVLERKCEDDRKIFVTDPRQVTALQAEPWKRTWRAIDANFDQHTAKNFQRLRTTYG